MTQKHLVAFGLFTAVFIAVIKLIFLLTGASVEKWIAAGPSGWIALLALGIFAAVCGILPATLMRT